MLGVTVYKLLFLMMLLPFSALGDKIGHRRLYQVSSGQTLFTLFCVFGASLPILLNGRMVRLIPALAGMVPPSEDGADQITAKLMLSL